MKTQWLLNYQNSNNKFTAKSEHKGMSAIPNQQNFFLEKVPHFKIPKFFWRYEVIVESP